MQDCILIWYYLSDINCWWDVCWLSQFTVLKMVSQLFKTVGLTSHSEQAFMLEILYFAFHFFLLSAFFALPLGGSESGRSTPSLSMYSDSKSSSSVYQQAPRHFHIPGRLSLLSVWSSIAYTCLFSSKCCLFVCFPINLWI